MELNNTKEKVYALLVNTRNANTFTGKDGYKSLNNIAALLTELYQKNKLMMKRIKKNKDKKCFICTLEQ